jgi:hypothetical protein
MLLQPLCEVPDLLHVAWLQHDWQLPCTPLLHLCLNLFGCSQQRCHQLLVLADVGVEQQGCNLKHCIGAC